MEVILSCDIREQLTDNYRIILNLPRLAEFLVIRRAVDMAMGCVCPYHFRELKRCIDNYFLVDSRNERINHLLEEALDLTEDIISKLTKVEIV